MIETLTGKRGELEKKAAEKLAEKLRELAKEQDRVVLGIPGGRSVTKLFTHLKKEHIPWNKIHIFLVDERFVPITHEDSNYKQAKESFIDELIAKSQLPKENAHAFNTILGLEEYCAQFDSAGKQFDIVLLSAGEDGHVASLFPNHPSIKNESDKYIIVSNSPKPPLTRISASRKALQTATISFLLFFGEGKQEAYKLFTNDEIKVEHCPAKIILNLEENYVYTSPS